MPELTWNDRRHLRQFFVESIRNHPGYPVVISEGDSWYSFPVHANIIDHLDELVGRRVSLLRLEDPGDELINMTRGSQFAMLKDYLDRYRPHVLLFSGGGNDIVGSELLGFLAQRGAIFDAKAALATPSLKQRFKDIKTAYEGLASMRDEVSPQTIIVTHGYGYAIPSGRKARLWGFSAGPWLRPFLIERGYTDPKEQRLVVRALIDRFNEIVDDVAKKSSDMVKIDLRPVIEDSEWNDEIHPTRKGFRTAAVAFRDVLRGLLPDLFP